MFAPLPEKPDHRTIELEVFARWEAEATFERLRTRNRGGPKWSFLDGPVTANKTMGVHTAWGRTLKDVFQRYKALLGFDQRYQNGFDCQGLWIEVGVEKSLGLNSKREIEEYGLDRFARKCRDVVVWSSAELTRSSKRLGQWMDWGNDYFTFSDTNIEYIWRFLRIVNGRGWLYRGHRATEWCPRCGTSLSQHELTQAGVYKEQADPSLTVRLPLKERYGEALLIWTTTPWTLPANVAAAVKPDAQYGMRNNGNWVAVALYPEGHFVKTARGEDLVGLHYVGPFDTLGPGATVEHRVIPWDQITLDQGTGIVHIAPGCGGEDFELSGQHGLAVLTPVDEAGRFYEDYGWLHGLSTTEAADQIVTDLKDRGMLVEAGLYRHPYPHCWRCDTPLIFRLSDDWFIAVDEIRPRLLAANATVEWTPKHYGKRMDDWLRNMGDWNISRRRFYGLPLPFYPCSCGHLTVIGSKAELEQHALSGLEQLEELHRPWVDNVLIRCEACSEPVRRIHEVGDVWLDAGIVPFATLGWESPKWIPGGYATGASRGLSGADLPDHRYWEQWFPAEWVSEMREQIRLWFYSLMFMSVVLADRTPYKKVLTYEKLLDAKGREMHGSWGNLIEAEEAFERMGADVMRWLYCAQPPTQNSRFGFEPAADVKRRLLTLWNSARFLVEYANIEGFRPRLADLDGPDGDLRPLDRWLLARTRQLVAESTAAYDQYLTVGVTYAFDQFVNDLSNWYIRRSRRRFWSGDEMALRTLWYALVQSLRVISPVMPFLTEHLWRILVAHTCDDAADSIFLAGWPEVAEPDGGLLEEIAEVRRIVELGRQARSASGLKLRQPLRRLVVQGARAAVGHADEIGNELRIKQVVFGHIEAMGLRIRPNLPLLGPLLGKDLGRVRAALEGGQFERLPGGRFRAAGLELEPNQVLVERIADEGWALASEESLVIALETKLDDELLLEGRVLDLIHKLNRMRKDAGFALTDRIRVAVPVGDVELLAHADQIKDEVLAVSVETRDQLEEPWIAKA